MGLAASQARLLTITARLADNELRSQTINNAKMRLATQSAQASDEYVSALNNAQMMFSNVGTDGLTQKQALTFNALTQYSQYNTQYGIVNSAGMIMVSEEDAAIFKNTSNNLEGFLKAHGLEWETTFFDETSGNLTEKIQSFYTGSYAYIGNLFAGMSNADLKQLYLDSLSQDASIENLNYTKAAQNYYQEILSLYKNSAPELRNEVLGTSTGAITEKQIEDAVADLYKYDPLGTTTAALVKRELLLGAISPNTTIIDDTTDNGAKFSLVYLTNNGATNTGNTDYLTPGCEDDLKKIVNSLTDSRLIPGNAGLASEYSDFVGAPGSTQTYMKKDKSTDTYFTGSTYTFGIDPQFTLYIGADKLSAPQHEIIYQTPGDPNSPIVDEYDWYYIEQKGAMYVECSDPTFNHLPDVVAALGSSDPKVAEQNFNYQDPVTGKYPYREALLLDTYHKKSDGVIEYRYVDINEGIPGSTPQYQVCKVPIGNNNTKEKVYHDLAEWYLHYVLNTEGALDATAFGQSHTTTPTLKGFADAITSFSIYGIGTISLPDDAKCLADFDEMIKKKGLTYSGANNYLKSVIGTYMADKMLDVLGEPKYAWVDKNDPANVGNADAKAQWLTNLFNRMQKGYKVLENGLAKSQEWLEYAFESGLVSMEQVDLSHNWVSMDYKSCSNIYEDTDNSATVAKAEAKYNRAMNDIKQKDNMFDLQLKNIDTEHSALQTEYDVIKEVMKKNIERTMKFDQNG